jgi:hypothetical protein
MPMYLAQLKFFQELPHLTLGGLCLRQLVQLQPLGKLLHEVFLFIHLQLDRTGIFCCVDVIYSSSISSSSSRARSPIRTPTRKSIVGSHSKSSSIASSQGTTYADMMARIQSVISSAHAPPKPEGYPLPPRSPKKSPGKADLVKRRLDDGR